MQQVAAQPPPYFSPTVPVSNLNRRQVAPRPSCPATVFPEVVLAPPTSPGFYPHSEWAALVPVQVGVRFQARAHHVGDGPGLLGAAI